MNFAKLSIAFGISMAMLFSTVVKAEEAASPLKITGKFWTQFSSDQTTYPPGIGLTSVPKMGFDIYRAYLIFDYKFNDDWKAYLVYDASRTASVGSSTTNGGFGILSYVKDMYIQNSNMMSGVGFRVGVIPTSYTSVVDGVTKTRWITTNLNDTSSGSTFAGATTIGLTPVHEAGMLVYGDVSSHMIDYYLMVGNGLEFQKATNTADTGISAMATFNIRPFLGGDSALKNLGFVLSDTYFSPARTTTAATTTEGANAIQAAVTYSSSMVDLAAEYAQQSENFITGITATGVTTDPSSGYGVTMNLKMGDYSLFGKYQTGTSQFQNIKLNANYFLTFGPTYQILKDKVMTAIIWETRAVSPYNNISNGTSSTAQTVTTNTIFWKWAANF